MKTLRCIPILILLFIDGLRQIRLTEGTPSCPRTLHDCDSVEEQMHSSIDLILSPSFMSHVFDYEDIVDMCRFFKTPSCSDSILETCKGEIIYSSRAFKSRQQTICGDTLVYQNASNFKSCSQDKHRYIEKCMRKRSEKLEEVSYVSHPLGPDHPWCNITNDYIACVYSVMALGCSMEIAEEYTRTANQSRPVVEAVFGYSCSFGHPLDVLKTTTPLLETTPNSLNRIPGVHTRYGRRPTRRSSHGAAPGSASVNVLLVFLCVVKSLLGLRDVRPIRYCVR